MKNSHITLRLELKYVFLILRRPIISFFIHFFLKCQHLCKYQDRRASHSKSDLSLLVCLSLISLFLINLPLGASSSLIFSLTKKKNKIKKILHESKPERLHLPRVLETVVAPIQSSRNTGRAGPHITQNKQCKGRSSGPDFHLLKLLPVSTTATADGSAAAS